MIEARPTERSMQDSFDDLLRALILAPTLDPNAVNNGSSAFYTLLVDAKTIMTRAELGLLIALIQRIALRRKWIVGVSR